MDRIRLGQQDMGFMNFVFLSDGSFRLFCSEEDWSAAEQWYGSLNDYLCENLAHNNRTTARRKR